MIDTAEGSIQRGRYGADLQIIHGDCSTYVDVDQYILPGMAGVSRAGTYVVWARDTDRVKIGMSKKSILKRVQDLQTGCPYRVDLIASASTKRHSESEMHTWFHKDRLIYDDGTRTEWFKITPTLIKLLCRGPYWWRNQKSLRELVLLHTKEISMGCSCRHGDGMMHRECSRDDQISTLNRWDDGYDEQKARDVTFSMLLNRRRAK
jgi:hypothetical protein